jgi:hypothetical protein
MVYGGVETYGRDKTFQETPNTQTAVFKYRDGRLLQFEARGRYTNHEGSKGQEVGNLFFGSEGWLEISGSTSKSFRGREREPFAGSKQKPEGWDGDHWANFLDAVRSGKNEDLRCDINEGVLSSSLALLANISYRVGRSLNFMSEYERFANDPQADALLTRAYRRPYVVPEEV